MTKIYFDLDGVLRNLTTPLIGFEVDDWHYRTKDGKNILDLIEEDLKVLENAPPTRYFPYIIDNYYPIHILTNQQEHWKPFTKRWIKKHFGKIKPTITYLKPEEKLAFIGNNSYLVEDYPLFSSYKNIILINRAYNKKAKAPIRISSIKELDKVLKRILTLDKN